MKINPNRMYLHGFNYLLYYTSFCLNFSEMRKKRNSFNSSKSTNFCMELNSQMVKTKSLGHLGLIAVTSHIEASFKLIKNDTFEWDAIF
jgi:hypothetical protein